MSSNSDTADDGHLDRDELPLSFGAFKPVGHIAVMLPDDAAGDAAAQALRDAGFAPGGVLHFTAAETAARFKDLLPEAPGSSGFGSEIQSMRQMYLMATEGCSLLVVHAPGGDAVESVERIARQHGAKVAKRYGRLLIEDLI